MPVGGFDLSNTTMTFLRSTGGYIVTSNVSGAIVPPSASATIIANGDDTTQLVALSSPMPVAGVVPGFSKALKQMQRGGQYKIVIPPEEGYGSEAKGPIPANSTLHFDVELLEFRSEAEVRAMQQMMMQQQQMMQQGGPGGPGAPPPGMPQ